METSSLKYRNLSSNKSAAVLAVLMLLWLGSAQAEIYKYQDANGRWHFSDRPPANAQTAKTVTQTTKTNDSKGDLKQLLYDQYSPQTPLQEATLSTVTVQSPLGTGSGFFVSEQGHILTNKHVIRANEQQLETTQQKMEQLENQIAHYEKQLSLEKKRLKNFQKEVKDYKQYVDSISNSNKKNEAKAHYRTLKQQERDWQRNLSDSKRRLLAEKQKVEQGKKSLNWQTNLSRTARNFKIVLKDGSKLNTYLIAVSKKYDLALLKLDKYTTPRLNPADAVGQGTPVYAIGSPVGLRDSVSSGVVSGFQEYFVQTNAKIYPGNSGGPLVNEDGQVVGINTMKKLTYKFEGLGFAIGIDTALKEFERHLR